MLLHTVKSQWLKVRSKVTTDDATTKVIGDSTKYFGARGSDEKELPDGTNGVRLAFVGYDSSDNDAEALTFVAAVYLRVEKGHAEYVYTATYTIGAQDVITNPWNGEADLGDRKSVV